MDRVLRTLQGRLEDCSTDWHIRTLLKDFEQYLFNRKVYQLFSDRIKILREFKMLNNPDGIEELLEEYLNLDIDGDGTGEITLNLRVKSDFGNIYSDVGHALIEFFMKKTKCKKTEICAILGITKDDLIGIATKEKLSKIKKSHKTKTI